MKIKETEERKVNAIIKFLLKLTVKDLKFIVSSSAFNILRQKTLSSVYYRQNLSLLPNSEEEHLYDELFKLLLQKGVIFVRMSYIDKQKLVNAMKTLSSTPVSYIGDGSNDSFAMQEADISVAVKGRHTRVADFYLEGSIEDYYLLVKAGMAYGNNELLIYSFYGVNMVFKNIVLVLEIIFELEKRNELQFALADLSIGFFGLMTLIKYRNNKDNGQITSLSRWMLKTVK